MSGDLEPVREGRWGMGETLSDRLSWVHCTIENGALILAGSTVVILSGEAAKDLAVGSVHVARGVRGGEILRRFAPQDDTNR
jgi:hypothetical protein